MTADARTMRRHRANPNFRERLWEGEAEYDPTPRTGEMCFDVLETWGDWLSPHDVVAACAKAKHPVSLQAVRRMLWRLTEQGLVESRKESGVGEPGYPTGRAVRFRVAERAYLKEE
jgi:hypothetical protein